MSNALIDHYKAVRARMGMAPPRPVVIVNRSALSVVPSAPPTEEKVVAEKAPQRPRPYNRPRPVYSTKSARIPAIAIQFMVADYFGISRESMIRSRKMQFSLPRHISVYLCRKLTDRSYPELSIAFERHHTTMMHSVRLIEQMLVERDDVERDVTEITYLLTGEKPFVYWGA